MIIKSITLNNIRSYLNERIDLPEGSTLLAGDIGCGKSSILQAVEYALFGIQKGELTGTDLLRHGKDNGYIELICDINNKEIIINRTLKRTKTGVSQDSGFIVIDNKKEEKTTTEMRATILQLLGYPSDYQTKNPVIYRYTVYTPQEEIKKIITEDNRADILRKAFEIDRYSVIRNNAETLLTSLRQRKRDLDIASSNLERFKADSESMKTEKIEIENNTIQKKSDLKGMSTALTEDEIMLEEVVSKIRKFNLRMQIIIRKRTETRMLHERVEQLKRTSISNESKIKMLEQYLSKITDKKFADLDESTIKTNKMKKESQRTQLIEKASILRDEIRRLEKILEKGICESCGQSVSDKTEFSSKISSKNSELTSIVSEIEGLKKKIETIETKIKQYVEQSFEKRRYDEKKKEWEDCNKLMEENRKDVTSMEGTIETLEKELKEIAIDETDLKNLEIEERSLKTSITEKRTRIMQLEKMISSMESDIKNIEKDLERFSKEIREMTDNRKKSEYISNVTEWITTTLIPLTEAMEKGVMTSIQQSFNDFFQKWFNMLVSGEEMNVEIDESFAPIIEQNGYQTDFQNLSGGEKTSVAMAYRLALNKTINDLSGTIQTKDIIILDEPTDGFSSEQIDKIRDILEELGMKQTIIVSHEPKVDSFVDNVIRIQKENHVSRTID
ncbi:MAG: AAA family ATPase [Candidatus Aenigmatarchaeota archaeon]